MGFFRGPDRIGQLSHSAGVIALGLPAGSLVNRYTVRGQQYDFGVLQRTISADVTLAANTLYMIYAQLVGGSVQLRISTAARSSYLTSNPTSELIGAFYSNGLSVPELGSFVNVIGIPTTGRPVVSIATWSISGFATAPLAAWSRRGRLMDLTLGFQKDGSAGVGATVLSMNKLANMPDWEGMNNALVSATEVVQINGGNIGGTTFSSVTNSITDWATCETYAASAALVFLTQPIGTGSMLNNAILANCIAQGHARGLPVQNWSNTPLMDL